MEGIKYNGIFFCLYGLLIICVVIRYIFLVVYDIWTFGTYIMLIMMQHILVPTQNALKLR